MPAKPFIIAIDGRAASGKTILAEQLSEILIASVIHMDDFFLLPEMRTDERLKQAGGNVHYERFKEEVLDKLNLGTGFRYQRFDCSKGCLADYVEIHAANIIIVEGSYSHHPFFGNYANLKIFKDVDLKTQWQRILVRNGAAWGQSFRDKWIPMEEQYFDAFDIKNKADIIL